MLASPCKLNCLNLRIPRYLNAWPDFWNCELMLKQWFIGKFCFSENHGNLCRIGSSVWSLICEICDLFSITFLYWNIFLSYGLITLTQGNKLLKPMVLNNWTSKSIAGIALWRAVWCPPDPHHIGSALNQSVEHRVLYSYIIDKIITFRLSLLQWTIYLGCLK